MTTWSERSPEIAALFNPAYCGILLYSATHAYTGRKGQPMPFENAFLVLPLVLHGPTRMTFPKSVASLFQSWVSGDPTIRIGLPERVRTAAPLTREAIIYMMKRQCLALQGHVLTVGSSKPKMSSKKINQHDEIKAAVQAAALLGRLLAGAGTSATIYTSLGIAP